MRIKYEKRITYQCRNIYDIVPDDEHIDEMIKDCYYFKDGKENGEYGLWWRNGKVYVHCYYKDGKKDGEYKEYDVFGNLRIYSMYKDGKKNRDDILYNEDGSIFKQPYYKDDEI